MKTTFSALAAAVAFYAQGISAATTAFCPSTDVCYRWAVPEAAASSGSGDVYFQIKAPTTYSWIGVGIGSRMSGAEIFVIYQDGSGNLTLSPRSGRGHVMPEYSARSGVQLITGSGVSNNEMTANIKCSDCSTLSLSGSNSWIAAWKQGSSLSSTSMTESITEHDGYNSFSVDFSTATFSASSISNGNPFSSSSTSTGSGNNSGSNTNSGSGVTTGGGNNSNTLIKAHGILLAIIFVIGYPIGSVLMPLLGKWIIHAGWQIIAFLGMWAGFGLGYVVARDNGIFWKNTHTKLGTIVCALMGLQPVLGWLHHQYFVKHQQRGVISHVHIWFGRSLMLLGIVNGGLGLKLARSSNALVIAYAVVAGVVGVAYSAGAVFGQVRRSRNTMTKVVSPQMDQTELSPSQRPRPRYS